MGNDEFEQDKPKFNSMKRVLFFKRIDIWAQVAAFFGPLIMAVFIGYGDLGLLAFGSSLFLVGGVQVVSCLMWLCRKDRRKSRRQYEIALLLIAISTIFLLAMPLEMGSGYYLLCTYALFLFLPLMAIWYAVITITEIRKIKGEAHINIPNLDTNII